MNALRSTLFVITLSNFVSPVLGQETDISNFARQVYIEGVPYEEVIRFDPATSVPVLLEMLTDANEDEYWTNIVITLGMLGDERAVDPLIR